MFDVIDLIKIITRSNSLHVCIQPIGNADKYSIDLPFEHFTHSKPFCNAAKVTDKGLKTCLENKSKAIDKALKDGDFSGYCVCGLYEFVRPVTINGKIRYIIYLGNILKDKDIAAQKINDVCQKTCVKKESLLKELNNAEPFTSVKDYQDVLDLLEFHLKRFHEENKQKHGFSGNYIIDLLKDFVRKNFDKNFLITDFAKTHKVNAKYLGRLFKIKEGITITEYLNSYRLEKAADLLKTTRGKVIDIAMNVGFFNVSYFNRAFKKKYGVSPVAYKSQKDL